MNKEEYIDNLLDKLDLDEWCTYLYEVPLTWCELYDIRDYIVSLKQENKQLKEKNEYLKNQKENKDNWFQLIVDIGYDYDGYNDVENLKHLIDELVKFALNGRDNYEYEDIFEELERGKE